MLIHCSRTSEGKRTQRSRNPNIPALHLQPSSADLIVLSPSIASGHLEETDDDERDEEPKLKYERLGNSMLDILKTDFASCMCVFERFLALGTRSGKIFVLDFNGNEIRRFSSHRSVVNEICVDSSGEFIASCSDDGKVVLNALYAPEPSIFTFNRVVKVNPAPAISLSHNSTCLHSVVYVFFSLLTVFLGLLC